MKEISSTIDEKTISPLFSSKHFPDLGYKTLNESIKDTCLVFLISLFLQNWYIMFYFNNITYSCYKFVKVEKRVVMRKQLLVF